MLAITVTEAVVLVILGLLVVGLLRSHAEILRALHELGAGQGDDAPAGRAVTPRRAATSDAVGGSGHDVHGETLDGESVAIGVSGATHHTLLAFLSAGCYTCQPFWSALSGGAQAGADTRVIVVVQGGDNLARLPGLAGPDLLVVVSDAAWSDYQVPGSPHFVLIDGPSGTVTGEGTASTWPQVLDLLEHAHGSAPSPSAGRPRIELSGRDNVHRIDLELANAGIGPGHPSLYSGAETS
jgi:hypothetical protein